jgi:hypothetical protein
MGMIPLVYFLCNWVMPLLDFFYFYFLNTYNFFTYKKIYLCVLVVFGPNGITFPHEQMKCEVHELIPYGWMVRCAY